MHTFHSTNQLLKCRGRKPSKSWHYLDKTNIKLVVWTSALASAKMSTWKRLLTNEHSLFLVKEQLKCKPRHAALWAMEEACLRPIQQRQDYESRRMAQLSKKRTQNDWEVYGILPLSSYNVFKSISHIKPVKRSKSKAGTSWLQSWNNLVHMVTDECKPSVLCVFLNHCIKNSNNKN